MEDRDHGQGEITFTREQLDQMPADQRDSIERAARNRPLREGDRIEDDELKEQR